MAIRQQLWSLNALASELGHDVRKIGRALNSIPPDGRVRGHEAWQLKTAINALQRYEARMDNVTPSAGVWAALEQDGTRVATALEEGIATIAVEPNITK